MIFNLFSYCDGFLKAPTLGQNNPIDNLSQQSNSTSEKDNFIPVVQENADVNFELESELNELATNKPFGNTVPQDEWKSDEVGGFFVKGGKFSALAEKLKSYGEQGLEKAKQGVHSAKKYTDDAIHEKKKNIALDVLYHLKENVIKTREEKKAIENAFAIVDEKYANGGGFEQKGSTDKAHDKVYKAKRVGYRYTDERAKKLGLSSNAKPTQEHIEKYLGNGVYKEDRADRSDKSRMKKLSGGGSAGNKGIMQKIQDEVKKLKAENPNMFKKHTDFVKKAASNLKSKGEL